MSSVSWILAQRLPANTSVVRASEVHEVDVYHLVQQRVEKLSDRRLCDHACVEIYARASESVGAVRCSCHPGVAPAGTSCRLPESMQTLGSLRQKKIVLKIL